MKAMIGFEVRELPRIDQAIEVDGSNGILYLSGTNGHEHEREELKDGSYIAC